MKRWSYFAAGKRYLFADDSKFGRTGLYRIAAQGGFDAVFMQRRDKRGISRTRK